MTIEEPKTSIDDPAKVDSDVVHARLERPLLDALDAWIAEQPEPRPTRPAAVRRLLAEALGEPADAGTIAAEELNASNDE
jgi:hypothetical protein